MAGHTPVSSPPASFGRHKLITLIHLAVVFIRPPGSGDPRNEAATSTYGNGYRSVMVMEQVAGDLEKTKLHGKKPMKVQETLV